MTNRKNGSARPQLPPWVAAVIALAVGLGFVSIGPVGCNTTEGFGEDLEDAGGRLARRGP